MLRHSPVINSVKPLNKRLTPNLGPVDSTVEHFAKNSIQWTIVNHNQILIQNHSLKTSLPDVPSKANLNSEKEHTTSLLTQIQIL